MSEKTTTIPWICDLPGCEESADVDLYSGSTFFCHVGESEDRSMKRFCSQTHQRLYERRWEVRKSAANDPDQLWLDIFESEAVFQK